MEKIIKAMRLAYLLYENNFPTQLQTHFIFSSYKMPTLKEKELGIQRKMTSQTIYDRPSTEQSHIR